MKNLIKVTNPHSILETLRARPQAVKSISVQSDQPHWKQVKDLAARHRIPSAARESQSGAMIEPREPQPIERFFDVSSEDGAQIFLILDCLQDPHNVGAIFRTAAFMGVRGIVLTEERSATLTGTVYDVASGAMEHLPFAMAGNLARTLRDAKSANDLWILGTTGLGETEKSVSMDELKLDRSWAIVFGNEEKGMRRLTLDLCDLTLTIPRTGVTREHDNADLASLNVSVAVGVVLSRLRFGNL